MAKITGKFSPELDPEIVLKGFGLQALRAKFYGAEFEAEEEDENAPDLTSYLGTPVFANLVFIPGSYVDNKGNEVSYGEILKNDETAENFQVNTVLIDVSQSKQIIKTNIQGVAGTVKEYISKGDYQITIRGALVSESAQRYPQEQVQQLREYLEVEAAVGVASRFLNDIFNVDEIVVEGFRFPQQEGYQNVQLFEITAISDEPVELSVYNNLSGSDNLQIEIL